MIKQKAIQEVANSYYRKGTNIQYESTHRDYFQSPEEATIDNILNTTCHAFAFQVYWQALGIEIPKSCDQALEYCEINKNTEYVEGHYNQQEYLDLLDNKDLNNHDFIISDEEFKKFCLNIASKLEIGDILTEKGTDSNGTYNNHTMLVESIIYDDKNKKIDANLIESNQIGGGLLNLSEDKLEPNGSINKVTFSSKFKKSYKDVDPSKKKHITEFAILRPIANGDKWYEISPEDLKNYRKNHNTEVTKIKKEYDLTEASISRLKYPKIDIYKLGSKHSNSIVGLGDEITYTITITNNSEEDYVELPIIENISEYVDIKENSINNEGIFNKDKQNILWNVNVKKGESISIQYTVKVKQENEYLNKTVISEGKVDNIKSATVINKIGNTLNIEQKNKIIEKVEELKNTYSNNGVNFINEIYKEALDVNTVLSNIKVNGLLDDNAELKENPFKEMVCNDLYARFEISYKIKNSAPWIWGTALEELKEQKKKKIVKGNINIGDIILVEENIDKAYIYLDEKIIGINEGVLEEYKSNKNSPNQNFDTLDEITIFLANLSSKKGFVILSPALMINLNSTEPETRKKGDVNKDNKITLADCTKILAHVKKTKMLSEEEQKIADVNNDNKVTLADFTKVLSYVKRRENINI